MQLKVQVAIVLRLLTLIEGSEGKHLKFCCCLCSVGYKGTMSFCSCMRCGKSKSYSITDQQVPVGRPNPDPHKLDLMAENSSLKVRLAKLEKHLQDSDEKFNTAQLKIDELQSRLNDRTIEVTELRTRLARSAPSSPNHSLSNSFKNKTIERERTLDRLKRKHYEVEKLKQAVETLMVTNEEKNVRIEELRSAVKHYKRMEEMLVKMQGTKVLEQLGIDGDNFSDGSSAQNSNGSSNDNAHMVDARAIMEQLDQREFFSVSGIPNPPVTSTPVNNHSVSDSPFISSSLKRNPHLIEGVSPASHPPASANSTQTDARSNSYDDITSAPSKTPPATIKQQADAYGTFPKDSYTSELQTPSSGSTTPSKPSTPFSYYSLQKRPPIPPHATSSAAGYQAAVVQSSTVPRRQRAFMSFGRGFLKIRHERWSCSAPALGEGRAFVRLEPRVPVWPCFPTRFLIFRSLKLFLTG